jgi:hypothetical protein
MGYMVLFYKPKFTAMWDDYFWKINNHHFNNSRQTDITCKLAQPSYRGRKHASSKPYSISLHVMRDNLNIDRFWLQQKKAVFQNQAHHQDHQDHQDHGTSTKKHKGPWKCDKFQSNKNKNL